MNPEITLRRATDSDCEALIAFNQAMAQETEGKELAPEIISAGVANLLAHPQYGFYIVAEVNGAVAGGLMVTFEWSDWRNGLFWWIQSVYIKPEFRRMGLYRRLYAFVKELAAEKNVCGFRLYVEKENRIAQQTYERLGMTESHYNMYEELL
ncbi:MAG: GNAT family N-acetyltransferase [Blastocatellia bacterium]|nr:GNAT family N-acetyltransferase [Blastocatellia bacterium]